MKICLECEGISDTQQETCASCGVRLFDTTAVHFPLRRGEADAANPLIGAVIDGKYLVQGVLGKGGMGTVFRAIHQVSLISVALKILNPRFSVRAEYREYFLAEAQKAGRVSHEHAGRILDVGEAEDGTVYIAMEEVNGVTLHECIHGGQPLQPTVVVEILEQICQGLNAAHHAGIVHRDLSPRNVMVVVRQGRPFVKILDFGIAKGLPYPTAADPFDAANMIAPAGFASPPYSAPEHLEGKDVDARADLYSLGVIAYEALTRCLPVLGNTPQERAEATVRGEIQPMQPASGTPARLIRLVRNLLATDPDDRPGSASEVLHALESIRHPQTRLVRDLAVFVFILAVVVCGMAYSRDIDPILAQTTGDLVVVPAAVGAGEVQHLRSERLTPLRFEIRGFEASELRAEVERESDHEKLLDAGLGAVDVDGVLELDVTRSTEYANFLGLLTEVCRKYGRVKVTFKVKGGAALGVARLLIDDSKPSLKLQHLETQSKVLNYKSRIKITCEDGGRIDKWTLKAFVGSEPPIILPLSVDELEQTIWVRDLFADAQENAAPLKGVRLTLSARDKAGNDAITIDDVFEVDIRVPSIIVTDVVADEMAATIADEVAQLKFRVSHEDQGLTVKCRRQVDQEWINAKTQISGTLVDLRFKRPEDLQVVPYEFLLTDGAGNEESFTHGVRFHEIDQILQLVEAENLKTRLRPIPSAKPNALQNDLVWSGAATTFDFRCNELYQPTVVALRNAPMIDVKLEFAEYGKGRIQLSEVTSLDDDIELVVTLRPKERTMEEVVQIWLIRVQTSRLELALPDPSEARFLFELCDPEGLLLRRGPNGSYGQTTAWRLIPFDSRLLRGGFSWNRPDDPLVKIELPVIKQPKQPFFVGQHPQPGHNRLCLMLTDVFGRDVDVMLGGVRAPSISAGSLKGAVKIAEFQSHGEIAPAPFDALQVEYQQPTRLIFRSDYAFRLEDRLRIWVLFRGKKIWSSEIRTHEEGTNLVFDLPYGLMTSATDLTEAELRSEGHEFDIQLELFTPAGKQEFRNMRVRTTRSSLVREVLGDRFPAAPKSLRGIEMVPVLRPLEEFEDRVTAKQRRAGGFLRKRLVPVKAIQDCYLQQKELTRQQYADIARTFFAIPEALRPKWAEICFPGDPLESDRLTETGMTPVARVVGDADRPITGISFYQAYAITRMAGRVIANDPNCFRLPFGVEMELAALGEEPVGTLNGVSGQRLSALRKSDVIQTQYGEIHGLDFGVREWVMDLPWPAGESQESQEWRHQVAGWLADHGRHLARATGFATMQAISEDLRTILQNAGVVRGRPLAEVSELARSTDVIGRGVPGVVHTLNVERSGAGLFAGGHHRLLPRIGLRLAGGEAFLQKVRTR